MKNPNRYLVIYILVAVIFACSWTITYGASVVSLGKDGTSEYLLYPTDSLSAHRFIGTSTSAVNTFPTALFTSASTTNFGITSVLSKILKTGSDGHIEGATAGVDYENPLTVTSPITRTLNALGFDFSTQNTWTGHNIFSSFFATNATTTNATTTNLGVTNIYANSSAGIDIHSNNGTHVAEFGQGGGSNATFSGGVNIDGATRLATSLTGLLKATAGAVSSAVAGTDYPGLSSQNTFTGHNIFSSLFATNASTTNATTSSFAVTGSGTSTFANGINLSTGCFAVGGVCVGQYTAGWLLGLSGNQFYGSSSPSFGSIQATSSATSTIGNLDGNHIFASTFAGSDVGAKVMNAYEVAATGSVIHMPPPGTWTTPINFGINRKYVVLQCTPEQVYSYTGSGSAVTLNMGYVNLVRGQGIRDCTLDGNLTGGTVGITLGGSNGAPGTIIQNVRVFEFATGTVISNNTWDVNYQDFTAQYNDQNVLMNGTTNMGEQIRFTNANLSDCQTGKTAKCVDLTSDGASIEFDNLALDDAQLHIENGNARVKIDGCHVENPNYAALGRYTPIVIDAGANVAVTISNCFMLNAAALDADSFYQYIQNGGNLLLTGNTFASYTTTVPVVVTNDSGLVGYISGDIGNSFQGNTPTSGIATSGRKFAVDPTTFLTSSLGGFLTNSSSSTIQTLYSTYQKGAEFLVASSADPIANRGGVSSYGTWPLVLQHTASTNGASTGIGFAVSSTLNSVIGGGIAFIRTGGSSVGDLAFLTNQSAGTSLSERMRILSTGEVGIGTTTPGNKLAVNGTGLFTDLLTSMRFIATSTSVASVFPYASTTAISATYASTTNLIVSSAGAGTGCAQFSSGGTLTNTGTACGTGGGGGDSKFSTSTINPLAIYMNAGDSLGLGTTTNRSALSMFTIATTTGTHITFRNGNHTWFQKVNDTGSLFIGTTTGAYATSSHTALIVPATGGLIVQGSGSSTLLNGITIQNGCFSINGTCIGSGGTLTGTNASAGRVPFWTSANNISGDDNFWWDNTNKRFGVGSSSPWAKFALVGEALTRPLFSVATSTTNGTYSTLFSVEQMPDKFTFLNPRSWANIHLGGATTSERFDMDNIEMFGRINRDTLLIDCNTLKSSQHTSLTADITAATAGSPCGGGATFDELTDADFSVVAPGQASSTDGLPGAGGSGANGCNDGGPWYAITASAVTPTQTAGIGGMFRGGTVANHTVATNPAMNVTGGLLVASGTPVMEVTICTPSASASSTIAFGFGFTDVALNTMPFNVGPTTANGAYFMASSTNTWRLVSHNGGTGSANTNIVETTLATSTTKATPQTFRIARTATSTYVYQMNYGASPATWTLVAVSSSQQTSRSFSWFIANVQTVVAKRRTHLYFRDLQVWYSPTYRF